MRTNVILITAAACWCGAILAAPAAADAADPWLRGASGATYAFFSTVCHQWESHSFRLFGHTLPVCIRCCAIYFSFLAGILFYPSVGRRAEQRYGTRTLIGAAAAGMIVDVTFSFAGIASSSTPTRLVTGGAFGLLMAFVLTPILHDIIGMLRKHLSSTFNHRTSYGTKTR